MNDVRESSAELPAPTATLRDPGTMGQKPVNSLAARRPTVRRTARVSGGNAQFESLLGATCVQHKPPPVAYTHKHGADANIEDVVRQASKKVWQRHLRPAKIANMDAYLHSPVQRETWRDLLRTHDDQPRHGVNPAMVDAFYVDSKNQVVDRVTREGRPAAATARTRRPGAAGDVVPELGGTATTMGAA